MNFDNPFPSVLALHLSFLAYTFPSIPSVILFLKSLSFPYSFLFLSIIPPFPQALCPCFFPSFFLSLHLCFPAPKHSHPLTDTPTEQHQLGGGKASGGAESHARSTQKLSPRPGLRHEESLGQEPRHQTSVLRHHFPAFQGWLLLFQNLLLTIIEVSFCLTTVVLPVLLFYCQNCLISFL